MKSFTYTVQDEFRTSRKTGWNAGKGSSRIQERYHD